MITTFTLIIVLNVNPFKIQIDNFVDKSSCKNTLHEIKDDFTVEQRRQIIQSECYEVRIKQ